MTPLDLQATIISELQALFASQLFPKVPANTQDQPAPVPLNIFKQALPMEENGDVTVYSPFIIVQLQNRKQDSEIEPAAATVLLNIGIYSDDPANNGHEFVCNIIETIRQDFFRKRILGGKYYITVPWEDLLNDDDLWPYFFGSVETHWNLPIEQPEDPNL